MTFVSDLEPKSLWKHFDRILTIPRGSKNERQMADYVISVAKSNGLSHQEDAAGNLVVRKPATGDHQNAPITILQSHLDMVNEKNADVNHDFTRDAIKPQRNNGYLTATGTTLGSDNGIGVAAALALMDDDTPHGPLEFLFTVDEETGLTGAANLQPGFLKGRRLINMDSEEEGALYVGCAGGAGVDLSAPLELESSPAGSRGLDLRLFGLRGGHSGVDIHLQRGNAIQLLARALEVAPSDSFGLADFRGGNMHNAIPREATATLCLAGNDNEWRQAVERELSALQREFAPAEPELKWEFTSAERPDRCLVSDSRKRLLGLLVGLPHGVVAMSYDIPELVETSANLATAAIENSQLKIHASLRSSVDSALQALQRRVAAIGGLAGARAHIGEGYPGWQPNLESEVLKVTRAVHAERFGSEPEIKAIHAGLECGLIGEKYEGMDMVSFGPQIEFPHSPDERVKIDSVDRFYTLLKGTLERLARH